MAGIRKQNFPKRTNVPCGEGSNRPRIEGRKSPTLVWIDDYEPGLNMYKAMYEHLGYRVHTASHGNEGLKILAAHRADAVIVDYEMPEMDGGAVTKSIKKRWPGLPVIMFSGSSTVPSTVTRLVDAFCDKAGHGEDLQLTIQNLVQRKSSFFTSSNHASL